MVRIDTVKINGALWHIRSGETLDGLPYYVYPDQPLIVIDAGLSEAEQMIEAANAIGHAWANQVRDEHDRDETLGFPAIERAPRVGGRR